jgi:hypothetical protein
MRTRFENFGPTLPGATMPVYRGEECRLTYSAAVIGRQEVSHLWLSKKNERFGQVLTRRVMLS